MNCVVQALGGRWWCLVQTMARWLVKYYRTGGMGRGEGGRRCLTAACLHGGLLLNSMWKTGIAGAGQQNVGGGGYFWPQGFNLNNLGRGLLSYKPNLGALGLTLSRRKIFHDFHYISLCKTSDPQVEAISDIRAIIWTIMVEGHYIKLHTKFGSARPNGFQQEDFSRFSLC